MQNFQLFNNESQWVEICFNVRHQGEGWMVALCDGEWNICWRMAISLAESDTFFVRVVIYLVFAGREKTDDERVISEKQ